MKIFLALTVTAVVHLPAFSQLKKIEKSFQQENYKKCIELSRKSVKNGKNSSTLSYYQCRSYFALYSLGKGKDLSLLDKCISLYPSSLKSALDTKDEFRQTIRQELERVSDSLAVRGNHGKSKVYVRTLAGHFKDTLALYSTYFPPPFPKTVKATIPEKKSNSVPKNGASSTLTSSSKEKRVSRTQVIQYAEKFKGVPYKWGGEDSSGFDCSGFVLAVMRKFGYSFNHGAKDQSELGRAVERESLKSGDLVFFGKKYDTGRYKIDHVGIVHTVDKDKLIVIHCTSRGVNVQEMKAGEYWSRKILFYRNIID